MKNTADLPRKDIATMLEHYRLLKMRRDGYSLAEVAAAAGVPPIRASVMIDEAIEELQGDAANGVKQARALELQRLDAAVKVLMPMVEAGELDAIDRLVKVQSRRTKYLGLDVATQVEQKTDIAVTITWASPDRLSYNRTPKADVIDAVPKVIEVPTQFKPDTRTADVKARQLLDRLPDPES